VASLHFGSSDMWAPGACLLGPTFTQSQFGCADVVFVSAVY